LILLNKKIGELAMSDNLKRRYAVVDLLRGIAVISMVLYHIAWDMNNIFGFEWHWFKSYAGFIWQQSICFMFIVISGFCYRIGSRHIKRGIIVFLMGAVISLITLFFMPENRIIFGILTFTGSAMLILAMPDKYLKSVPPLIGFAVSILLFVAFYRLKEGYLSIGIFGFKLPKILYGSIVGTYLGFMKKGFFSTDYYPVFPWLFLFLTGYYGFDLIGGRKRLDKLPHICFEPVNFAGRHALIVYLLHQPAAYLLLKLIF